MSAKVFISWSGELSKALGEAVRDWIPKVLQSVKPYFTPDDIEKGARWSKEISQELSSSQLGIICLTQDNQNSPWILFEAGALSKNLKGSKVCPILFNFDTADLIGPLASFQATKFTKEEFKKLIESINISCNETKLEQKNLDETFEMWWPKLDEKVKEILNQDKSGTKPKKRDTRDMIEEILDLTRSNAKSILSEQKSISRLTVEELVTNFRRIKERNFQGNNIENDLIIMESIVNRLCKEGNFENLIVRRPGLRSFYNFSDGDARRAKNSVRESDSIVMKRRRDDDVVSHQDGQI